jgi:hypothetical protein
MDINDRGPLLDVGRFAMRVTNIGVVGNAFFDKGLSFDPSFEFPRGSGNELLNHADLWVGARTTDGMLRVSGGPMLEWRPTLDPADTVRVVNAGDPGTRSYADDDGDGRVDEELLNGRDDDGDGRVDEDVRLPAQQMLAADYTDDQPEAVNYAYPTGERHVPLRLAVHQEAYAWTLPGHDDIAGIEFTITNRGSEELRDVRLGFYADLDARTRNGSAGHLDDRVFRVPFSVVINSHLDTLAGPYEKTCVVAVGGEAAMVRDASLASPAPAVAILPLSHTTDPLGWFINDAFPGVREARALSRAPRRDTTFRLQFFVPDAPPGQGGPPPVDVDRYRALAGEYPTANTDEPRDYAVLVSCGPFARLGPGESVAFSLALFAVSDPDSVAPQAFETAMLYRGQRLDLQANTGPRGSFNRGETGWNGHEICYSPPPGIVFDYDPHCPEQYRDGISTGVLRALNPLALPPGSAAQVTYRSGQPCVWTNLDCDFCTGDDGVDTIRHWDLDVRLPPSPAVRVVPGDHSVRIEWDNAPEQMINAAVVGSSDFRFAGYKVYRLDDWHRESELPEPERWQRLAVYRADPTQGGLPLADIIDPSLPPDGSGPGGPHYPVGRYHVEDGRALNGFDYHYVVTTILRGHPNGAIALPAVEYESPFRASFEQRVVPHTASRPTSGAAWVVPNPYRANASWERQAVAGDAFTRHIDFMGLPKAKARIRIYTLAGDLVQTIDHDGSNGDGQAPWNLISRNGQDVESGVYLFTVDSPLGHQVGRFVLLR